MLPLLAGISASPPVLAQLAEVERQPLVVIVELPKGLGGTVGTSELLRVAKREVERRTSLLVLSTEQAGIDASALAACEIDTRLSCWLGLARPDLGAEDERRDARAVGAGSAPRFLLGLVVHPEGDQRLSMSALLLDAERARAAVREVPRGPDQREALEARLFELALRPRAKFATVSSEDDLVRFFEEVLESDFRGALETAGSLVRLGAIEVEAAGVGVEVRLDGRPLGLASDGWTHVADVRPGRRTLELALGERLVREELEVPAGGVVRATPDLARLHDRHRELWTGTLVTGLSLFVAGAALTTYALANTPEFVETSVCFTPECEGAGPRFANFCELGADERHDCAAGGLLAAPLGYSLAATGGVMATSAWVGWDPATIPWLPWVLGLSVGGAAYAVSAALNP